MPSIKNIPSPEKPADALAAVVALRRMADILERQTVKNALDQGWTWTQIANALGVSRQAAHKRLSALMKARKSSRKAEHV